MIPQFPMPPMPPNHVPTSDFLPVGTVIAFAGNLDTSYGPATGPTSTPPPKKQSAAMVNVAAWGWLPCNGDPLEPGQYPELFATLGYQYGKQGDKFLLPNYQGYFLRGVSGNSGNDPDVGERTVPPTGEGTNEQVGSVQSCALQTHQHSYDAPSAPGAPALANDKPAVTLGNKLTGPPTDSLTSTNGDVLVSPNETRPKNIYVHYLIKYATLRFQ